MNWKGRLGSTLGIFAAILGVWWFVSRKTMIPSPAAAFTAIVKAEPITIQETIRIQPDSEKMWNFSAPAGKYPGRLTGHWTCRGKSAGILSAHDDSLVSFKLVGPDNRTIQHLDHPTAANVDIRVDGPGVYTFTFNNGGILRPSARVVEFDGTYQPD
jgi:hypothetical protein